MEKQPLLRGGESDPVKGEKEPLLGDKRQYGRPADDDVSKEIVTSGMEMKKHIGLGYAVG